MSFVSQNFSPLAACTSKIYRPEGGITGLRRIHNGASRVAVWACPMPLVARIALDRAIGVAAYILASHDTVYIGETKNGFSRVTHHLVDPSKAFAREVYVVAGYPEPWLDKLPALYLQHRLWEIAQSAGFLNIANARTPVIPVVPEDKRGELERYVEDARTLLFEAGCRALDSNFDSQRQVPQAGDIDEDPIGPEDTDPMQIDVAVNPPIGAGLELNYTGIYARGYPYADGGFVVMPGSEVRKTVNASAHKIIIDRRNELKDRKALVAIHGDPDRLRLVAAVWFPSAAIAAKVVTGAHIGSRIWQPVRHPNTILIAN
jgi:hypothetical protein